MTTKAKGEQGENRFVLQRLPWLIGAGGLLVYLVTLSHWLTLPNLGTVARTAGWLWQPELGRPLTLLVLSPFRCLPDSWLPLTLNLFTAASASLVLVQLARSVALLRYDVIPDDPFHQSKSVFVPLTSSSAWIPPVLAALVCGLQLGFWGGATSATGEMISLFCFAYAVRCLSEFRINRQQSWLSRCACVYAAGMTDNWMMVGYFPVLLAAIILVKGFRRFLKPRFLLRMTLWGLAGLGLYLLLPTLLSVASDGQLDFWQTLKLQLKSQKQALVMFRSPDFRLLLLTALLPALLLSVRWRSHAVQSADDSGLGVFLVKVTGHFAHGLFFIASLWIALNPALAPQNADAGLPLLVYYYVWAFVTGYCAGYFLLFKAGRRRRRPARLPVFALRVLIGAVPLVLLWKNLPELRITNGPAVHDFARELYAGLPAGKSVVLSENPRQLLWLRAELAAHDHDKEPMLVETPALFSPQYHEFMVRRHGSRWPSTLLTNRGQRIAPGNLQTLISQLAAHEPAVYLHPSSGFFFEPFTDEPNGSIHYLKPRMPGATLDPALADPLVAANEQIWRQRWEKKLGALAAQFSDARQNVLRWSQPEFAWLHLSGRKNPTAAALGAAYSKALNHWGVQASRAGHRPEAMEWFRRAIELNPDNLAAHINLEYTRRCQNGDRSRLVMAWTKQRFPELFGKYESWWEVVSQNGPVDEPTFLLHTGRVLLDSGNPRQAAGSFARCLELSPDWLAPRLWQAQCFNRLRNFTGALALTDDIQPTAPQLTGAGLAQLLRGRTVALRQLGRTNDAAAYLERFVAEQGMHVEVLAAAATLYAASAQLQKELELREKLLQRDPNNPELLFQKGQVELRLARHETAIATLTQALTLSPTDGTARLLRAVAYLRAGQLDAAKADYQELLKQPGTSQSARFGLGGIAWREHDTNAVIQHYQQFLSNSAAASRQSSLATQRLRQLTEE